MSNAKPLFQVSKKQVDLAQAKAITKLNRKVSKLVKANHVDSHYIDVAQTLSPGTGAVIGYLTPVAQGDGENNRDGDAIALKYLTFKATLVPNSVATSDSFRIILFRWKGDTRGTAPAPGAVLQTPTNIDSTYNRDYRESLKVIYDRRYDASAVNGNKHVSVNVSLHNVACTFYDTTASSYNENHIWFLFLATDNVNKANINYYSRVTFSP